MAIQTEYDVAVVGGGISGLTAAYKANSRRLILFEKESRTGGKLKTVRTNGFVADIGAQFILSGSSSTFQLFEELRIKESLRKIRPPVIAFFREGKINPLNPSLSSLLRSSCLSTRSKVSLIRMIRKIAAIDRRSHISFYNSVLDEKHDSITISDWIEENFNDELLQYLVQPIITALTFAYPEELSAAYGITLLKFGFKDVFALETGMDLFTTCLERSLGRFCDVAISSSVKEIHIEDDAVKEITFMDSDNREQSIRAQMVISAVPAPILPELAKIPGEYAKKLSTVEYSPGIIVSLGTKRKVFDKSYSILFPRIESKCISALTESAFKISAYSERGAGLLSVFINGESSKKFLNREDEWIRDRIIDELRELFPNLNEEEEWFHVDRWKYGVPIHKPRFAELKHFFEIPVKGLILCGDYLYMPSIEAAVYSGLQASRLLNKI